MDRIPLIKPYLPEEILPKIASVLESGYLTEGPVTGEFVELCRSYLGVKYADAMCNCTVALEVALRAIGVGPGDEVIVPDHTYPATATAVAIAGGKPVLVDVNPQTFLLNLEAAEAAITDKTKAIMPVSLFGSPLDYDAINAFKQKHGLIVIEDAACSIGAKFKDKMVGAWADISTFSFHPRKFITTGEGGLVTTDNPEWGEWMHAYKHFGMQKAADREAMVFGIMGTNYRLSNLQGALGVAQMKIIDKLLDRRIECAERYLDLLGAVSEVELPLTVEGGRHSYQTFCVFVKDRDRIMQAMRAEGIEVQIGNYSLHMHPAFQDPKSCEIRGSLEGSKWAFEHTLALPLFYDITEEQQRRVVERLKHHLVN